MKKILAMVGLAAALSGCVVIVDPGNSSATPTSVSLTSSKYQNANGTEYYICGNQNNTLQVSFGYTGTLSSYTIALVGDSNGESQGLPRFGAFQFSTANGDTSTAVSRSITLTTNDIKPFKDRLTTQAVVVTPVPSDYGLGSFTAKVFLTGTDGTTNSLSSSQRIKVLTDKSSLCQ